MTIQKQYYLNCNGCDKLYNSKSDSPLDLEEEAIDDGWVISKDLGTDCDNEILSEHLCSECAPKSED